MAVLHHSHILLVNVGSFENLNLVWIRKTSKNIFDCWRKLSENLKVPPLDHPHAELRAFPFTLHPNPDSLINVVPDSRIHTVSAYAECRVWPSSCRQYENATNRKLKKLCRECSTFGYRIHHRFRLHLKWI